MRLRDALVFGLEAADGAALPAAPPAAVVAAVQAARFAPCAPSQPVSHGWMPPRPPVAPGPVPARRRDGDGASRRAAAPPTLVETVAGHWLLSFAEERRAIPAPVLREHTAQALDRIERETGRRPRGAAARAVREQVQAELLPRAFALRRETPVWVDPRAGRVVVAAPTLARADAALTRLSEALGPGARVRPMATAQAPATAMTGWLMEGEAPAGFALDRDCELRDPDGEHATVRYARHALDAAEIAAHVRAGKRVRQLALTWRGRWSFVLHESGALRRLQRLEAGGDDAGDGAPNRRSRDRGDAGEDRFDADAVIATAELGALISDLTDALGGPLPAPAASGSAAPPPEPQPAPSHPPPGPKAAARRTAPRRGS